jgi:hypothetical protein
MLQRMMTSWRLLRALPWRRFRKGAYLDILLEGALQRPCFPLKLFVHSLVLLMIFSFIPF